MHVLIIYCHL